MQTNDVRLPDQNMLAFHCPNNFPKPLNMTSISVLKTTITSSIEYLHSFECEADQVLSSTVAWEVKLVDVYAKLLG